MKLSIKVVFALLLCSFSLVFTCGSYSHADSIPPGPFEQVGTIVIPAGYAELLNFYGEAIKKKPTQALKDLSEKFNRYNQAIGRIAGIIDVGGKIYTGELKEAAISGGLTALGELASSNAGQALLKAAGLTTLPVTTFIAAVQIYRASDAALQSATAGRQLESLYGSIESDPILKNTKRSLGTGDPIPVTQEHVEYLWRKILFSTSWRDLFKTYVSQELGKTWPEASLWESWTLPGNSIEDAALIEHQQDYKSYIAGLLSHLNYLAKKRESSFVMQKYIRQLEAKFANVKPEEILRKYVDAVKQLPKIKEFIGQCPELISRGLQDRNPGPLVIVIDNSKSYAVNVLAFLPTTGPLSHERETLMASLKSYYNKAWSARDAVLASQIRENQRLAAAVPVRAWRAKRIGFDLSFSSLKSMLQEEFSKTGTTEHVDKSISSSWDRVFSAYKQQEQAVKTAYLQAQENPPVSAERNESAYDAFREQLQIYKNMDNQQYNEMVARVRDFKGTLQQERELRDNALRNAGAQLRKIALESNTIVNRGTELISRYCDGSTCSFPPPNYVGLTKMSFPQPVITESKTAPANFYQPLFRHIDKLSFEVVSPGRLITFPNGRKHGLVRLMGVADDEILSKDALTQFKIAIERYKEGLEKIQSLLEDYPGPLSWSTGFIARAVNDVFIPFLNKIIPLEKQLKELATTSRNMQHLYQTTLENVEKDAIYLDQLRPILLSLQPILSQFSRRYTNTSVANTSRSGLFLFNPEVITDYGSHPACNLIDHSPTLMTPKDITKAVQQLQPQLQASGLVWLDQKYNLGLEKFLDSFIRKYTRLKTAKDPGHYQFIDLKGTSCKLTFNDEFDALLKSIQTLKISSHFPKDVSHVRANFYVGLETLDLDLDPENHFGFARGVVKKSWDPVMASSIQKVIDAFTEKVAAYREWQEKETYFEEKLQQFEVISAKFSHDEYDAKAASNAMAKNEKLLSVYEKAAANEPTIMGFLSGAAADPKLSSFRQKYFSRRQPEYKQRFYWINEMIRNFKLRVESRTTEDQLTGAKKIIIAFYDQFKQAYEAKNESLVMSFIADDWTAAGGVTLFDLEDNLSNMYNVFDDIEYSLSELSINSAGQNVYDVSYSVTIRGTIFDNDLTHEEASSVNEQIVIDGSGKPKIKKTLGGNYWSIQ